MHSENYVSAVKKLTGNMVVTALVRAKLPLNGKRAIASLVDLAEETLAATAREVAPKFDLKQGEFYILSDFPGSNSTGGIHIELVQVPATPDHHNEQKTTTMLRVSQLMGYLKVRPFVERFSDPRVISQLSLTELFVVKKLLNDILGIKYTAFGMSVKATDISKELSDLARIARDCASERSPNINSNWAYSMNRLPFLDYTEKFEEIPEHILSGKVPNAGIKGTFGGL